MYALTPGGGPPARISTRELAELRCEELEYIETLTATLQRAIRDIPLPVSRKTLDALLHGRRKRLTWKAARTLHESLAPREWGVLRVHLWPGEHRREFERRLLGT